MSFSGKQNKKKEKGHIVPSRYKQAAEKVSSDSNNSRENATPQKDNSDSLKSQSSESCSQNTLSSSKFSTSQRGRGATSTPASTGKYTSLEFDASAVTDHKEHIKSQRSQARGNACQDASSCLKFGTSQEGRGMTSTPAFKGKCTSLAFDASVVTDHKEYQSLPPIKEGFGNLQLENVKRNPIRKNNVLNETRLGVASHKDKKKNELVGNKMLNETCLGLGVASHEDKKKNEHCKLDILYAEYLQSAFLKFEAKKALEKRSSVALEKIHKLFCLVMLHVENFKVLQRDMQLGTCLLRMHEHCLKQESIFKPVLEIITTLEEQYKSLAEAVNATKHKLTIRNVVLPEQGSEGEIINLLEKANDVICEFLKKFKNIEEIHLAAEITNNYTDEAVQILDALKRGSGLLAKAKDLLLSEAFLELGCEKH